MPRATSHMSQGLWPMWLWGPLILKDCTMRNGKTGFVEFDMVNWNLHQAYFLKVGLAQSLADYKTLFTIYHMGIHVDLLSMIISTGP